MINKLKQLRYPKEFRITAEGLHFEAIEKLKELINLLSTSSEPPQETGSEKIKELYASLSIGAWRLKKKMIDPQTQHPLGEMSRAFRHLESILDTLEKEGIEIKDHDNMPFDSGLSLKVLTFQPTPGLKKEMIIETIKPSVYYKDERIVMGEVIVGSPEKE